MIFVIITAKVNITSKLKFSSEVPITGVRIVRVKRIVAITAAFVISTSSISALEIPIIAGLGAITDFSSTTIQANHAYQLGYEGSFTYSILSAGFFAFFDVDYVEFSLGFTGLFNYITGNEMLSLTTGTDREDADLSGATVNISLMGKYPFEFNRFTIFPLLGIEGRICISMRLRDNTGYDQQNAGDSYQGNATDWSTFWFRIGAGADFFLNEAFFIRTELTFGIKVNTARENAVIDRIATNPEYKDSTVFGAGGKLTVAIGYYFGSTNLALPSWLRGRGGRGGGGSSSGASDPNIYRPVRN